MDTKRMITGMLIAMMVILGYNLLIQWWFAKNNWSTTVPSPTPDSIVDQATTDPSTTAVAQATTSRATGQVTTAPAGLHVVGATTQPSPQHIGSDEPKDPTYTMELSLEPAGAAIDGVILNQFKLELKQPERYSFHTTEDRHHADRAFASRSVTINGQQLDLSNVNWTLDSQSDDQASWYVDVMRGSEPVARVRKTYRLDKRPESAGQSEGYEVTVTVAIENRGAVPITASTSFNGPPSPRPETSAFDRTVLGAYNRSGMIALEYRRVEELTAENPTIDITRSENGQPLVWAGIGGTYFNGIVRPLPSSNNLDPSQYIQSVIARAVHPEREGPRELALTFTTADQRIEPNGAFSFPMKVFFGPKQRSLVNNDYYSAPLLHYGETLVMTSGPCGWCTFTWLIDILVNMMRGFHFVLRDWGLAIIALVCVVRLILHPITKKSQVNMMKMSKMGPEIERLKKKFGDDKEAMAKAQMELYKEMGFTPVLGCLPMFLQMPIFIALWQALQSTFELRQAPFLWFGSFKLTWIGDLSQPDRLIPFGRSIPLLFGMSIDAINLLPILVAVVSYLHMKYTPRPPAATKEAEQQQKMMQWMTLIFPLFFYAFPSGLNIYYLTSTSIGIWEGRRIRQHIKEQEEAEKAGKVIVDASPSRRTRSSKVEARPKPQGGIAGWLQRLQERAEQMRNESDKRDRRK